MKWFWLAVSAFALIAACSSGSVSRERDAKSRGAVVSRAPVAANLEQADPRVRWEQRSMLRDDFDCDGVADLAALGRVEQKIVVGLARAAVDSPDLLEFAIDPAAQAGICTEPASLSIEPQDRPDGELEGFRPSRSCKGLVLSDGECDPVHIYWNHERKRPGWWRN